MTEHGIARRSLIQGASLLGAGLLATPASAQPATAEIWSGEYRAKKGDVSLALYRKRLGVSRAGEALPVLFLVHGSSVSARPSWDLTVPGHGEHSFMNV